MNNLNDLTDEEKTKSYAKYFYEPAVPAPEKLALHEIPVAPEKALPVENLDELLNPGYFDVESGWCVLSNGAGYVANHTVMPGVTVDMVNWWFAWHSLEPLRYKLWWPEGHYGISIMDEDRRKVLDQSLPLTQKFQGLTHHVVEDTGNGPENIFIHFLTPEEVGFAVEGCKTPFFGTLIAGNGLSASIQAPADAPKAPAFMLHFVREIADGVEFRSRFWIGYQMIEKKPCLVLPPNIQIPSVIPQGLARHNVCEYNNLAAFLPKLYQEQQGRIE